MSFSLSTLSAMLRMGGVICFIATCRGSVPPDLVHPFVKEWYNMLFQHVYFWKYIGYLKMTSVECHDFRMLVPI